jgi:hypothetical protein
MMRIGSSLGEQTPLKVAATADTVSVLDETPGWLGDLDRCDGGELTSAMMGNRLLLHTRKKRDFEIF